MRKFICDLCGNESQAKGYLRISFTKTVYPYDSTDLCYIESCSECEPGALERLKATLKSFNITVTDFPKKEPQSKP